MLRRILLAAAGSLVGLALALLLLLRPETAAGPKPGAEFLLPVPLPAPDFELISHTGDTVTRGELAEGRTLVLFFGYTHCPDICPLTMAALGRARALLGDDAERVLGVLITVDPARDSVEQLAAYVARFAPGIIGLTGSLETLTAVAKGYLATAERAPDPGHNDTSDHYLIDHTARSFVVHEGAMRMTFPPLTAAPTMANGLRLLLGS